MLLTALSGSDFKKKKIIKNIVKKSKNFFPLVITKHTSNQANTQAFKKNKKPRKPEKSVHVSATVKRKLCRRHYANTANKKHLLKPISRIKIPQTSMKWY